MMRNSAFAAAGAAAFSDLGAEVVGLDVDDAWLTVVVFEVLCVSAAAENAVHATSANIAVVTRMIRPTARWFRYITRPPSIQLSDRPVRMASPAPERGSVRSDCGGSRWTGCTEKWVPPCSGS